jgi:hypothetical protein
MLDRYAAAEALGLTDRIGCDRPAPRRPKRSRAEQRAIDPRRIQAGARQ